MRKVIDVNGKKYEVVAEFPVLWSGWEMDNVGFVIVMDGKHIPVMSNHGRYYFARKTELEEKLTEYQRHIDATQQALDMLDK